MTIPSTTPAQRLDDVEPRLGDTVISSTDGRPVVFTVERIVHEARGSGYPDQLGPRTTLVGRTLEGRLFGSEWRHCLKVPHAYASGDVELERMRRLHEEATTRAADAREALKAIVEALTAYEPGDEEAHPERYSWSNDWDARQAGGAIGKALGAAREVLAS